MFTSVTCSILHDEWPSIESVEGLSNMWSGPEDPTRQVKVSRAKLVEAYDAWRAINGRAQKGSNIHSNELFVAAISNSLDLSRAGRLTKIGLPLSRSAWSNWRAGRSAPLTELRLDVCRSIMSLTKIDVTANGFLKNIPVNVTDFVTLGTVQLNVNSNNDGANALHIVIDWVDFRVSGSKDIILELGNDNANMAGQRRRIGSVRYALKEASLSVESAQVVQPTATYIQDGSDSSVGKIVGLELSIDSEEFTNWRVQPSFPREILQGRIEKLHLCHCKNDENAEFNIFVSITPNDIETNITLDQFVTMNSTEYQNTRQKLIGQILRNRITLHGFQKRYVLSHSYAVRT